MKTVTSKTPTKTNPARCWMNITKSVLKQEASAGRDYAFVCDVHGSVRRYVASAADLLAVFELHGANSISNPQPKWSFYIDFMTGKLYRTVSANDATALFETTPCGKAEPAEPLPAVAEDDVDMEAEVDAMQGCTYLRELGIERGEQGSFSKKSQEVYNFHQLSSRLSEYGFESIRVMDDNHGADFLAYHARTCQVLKIQLKGNGVHIHKKYEGKALHMAFTDGEGNWYLILHDHLLTLVPHHWLQSKSYREDGWYYASPISKEMKQKLQPYML